MEQHVSSTTRSTTRSTGRLARWVGATAVVVALGVGAAAPSASAQEMEHGRSGCTWIRC